MNWLNGCVLSWH